MSAKRENDQGADPGIAARLNEDMTSLANLVTTAPAAMFVDFPDTFTAAQVLTQALETALFAAQAERDRRQHLRIMRGTDDTI